jgi:hypothetical protein
MQAALAEEQIAEENAENILKASRHWARREAERQTDAWLKGCAAICGRGRILQGQCH